MSAMPNNQPAFRNMNELTAYLSEMEQRLAALEGENKALKNALGQARQQASGPTFRTERGLPKTGLISDSFWIRAFTVWGHYFVAQLLISIPMVVCYLIFMFSIFGNMQTP
jgi:hypothetical protein